MKETVPQKGGVTPEDWQSIDNLAFRSLPRGERRKRIRTLQAKYAGDETAQEQIRAVTSRRYANKIGALARALQSGNQRKAERIQTWLKKNYPRTNS